MIDGNVVQTMLSAREIAQQLPSQSDTWVNRHLQYTHGYGLVMNSVTETTQQGEPRFLLRDIPPTGSSDDLVVATPPSTTGGTALASIFLIPVVRGFISP